MKFQCPREREVTTAVFSGRWPLACEPALLLHIDKCDRCAAVILIAEALRRDRAETIQAAPLASPGLLWWRAQILRRQRAMEEIAKPITFAGSLALYVASIIAIVLLIGQRSRFADWLELFADSFPSGTSWAQVASMPAGEGFGAMLLMLSAATLGLIGCFALYLAIRRE